MPYTERSRANLLQEGFGSKKIFVIGNPIYEVIRYHRKEWGNIERLQKYQPDGYFLATAHREENVDFTPRLSGILEGFRLIVNEYHLPVVFSCHPRTRERIFEENMVVPDGILVCEPFGLFDFLTLEKYARCILTDSGTVQEEAAIFKKPCVTLRDTTERPETIECGSNMLVGVEPERILLGVKTVLENIGKREPPREYLVEDVSDTVCKIVLGI
jgi:UDP-N-acetylglucosamine 2-epimerase (non-hydrolysing)